MTIARIANGQVVETREIDLADVPEHKRAWWLPVVGVATPPTGYSGPTYQIGETEVTRVWTPVLVTAADVLAAKQRVAAFADSLAAEVTGPVSETERASWPTKEIAARAYLDGVAPGTATATQVAMLQSEADLTGETPLALAQKIVDNADSYVEIAGLIAGQRRATYTAIDALEIGVATVADLEAVLTTARTQAEAALQQILSQMP